MAEKMYAITPSTGVPLTHVHQVPMVQVGSKVIGLDGHDYLYVFNPGGEIAADTAVSVDDTTKEVSAGAGGWSTQGFALTASSYGWVRRQTL